MTPRRKREKNKLVKDLKTQQGLMHSIDLNQNKIILKLIL